MTTPQPRIGVLRFPGACDDRDALWALAAHDAEAVFVWHT
jgi:phosphoribosylformylglycinamidine (FGAM) synthase-like amidotransferase family enzyme